MPTSKSGFSLVEGAIVLAIIGVVSGVILIGKSLYESAQMRSQIAQINAYDAAVTTFETKYQNLPGDISNRFAAAYGLEARGVNAGEGDGNGFIEAVDNNGTYGSGQGAGETVMFWKDLAKSGLIEGAYTAASPNTVAAPVAGKDIDNYMPKAKIGKGNYLYVWGDSNNEAVASVSATPAMNSISSAGGSRGRGHGNGVGHGSGNCGHNSGNGSEGEDNGFGHNGCGCNGGGVTVTPPTTPPTTPPPVTVIPDPTINGNGTPTGTVATAYRNYYGLSAIDSIGATCPGCLASHPGISAVQAQNIDTKMDDGMPQSGVVKAMYISVLVDGYDGVTWAGQATDDNQPTAVATYASADSCYDNGGAEGAPQRYSVANGSARNCGLSFAIQ